MKKFLKILLCVVAAIVVLAALFILYLTVREYRPEAVESVAIRGEESGFSLPQNEALSIVTWNVGYCGLGKDSDFVMDGGGNAPVPDRAKVDQYTEGVKTTIDEQDADIYILQEVDVNSSSLCNTLLNSINNLIKIHMTRNDFVI